MLIIVINSKNDIYWDMYYNYTIHILKWYTDYFEDMDLNIHNQLLCHDL